MDTENYYTVFHKDRAIPLESLDKEEANHIGMDTHREKEGLHFWIGKHVKLTEEERKSGNYEEEQEEKWVYTSVHLTRDDARNLIKEIKERLF